ncbi:MAG: DedA family protein [Dermatophilaceae bacterium]
MTLLERLTGLIESLGELGVGLLIALETILPPIPSEAILPFAGFAAAQGRIDPVLVWVAATAGSLIGAGLLYWLGAALSYERIEDLAGRKWFPLFSRRDLERGFAIFDRYGGAVVLLGRLIPIVRSVVSLPAGVSRMPLPRFFALTAAGSGLWNGVFIALGYRLGSDYAVVEQWVGPVATGVLIVGILTVVWLAVRRRRQSRPGAPQSADGADGSAADSWAAVGRQGERVTASRPERWR